MTRDELIARYRRFVCKLRGHGGMTIVGQTRSWLLMRCKKCGAEVQG
jgi:hypothetical protein